MTLSRRSQFCWLLGAWTLAGVLFALQMWLAGSVRGQPIGLDRSLAIWLTWGYTWALLTPVAWWLAVRRPLRRPRLPRAVALHLLASVVLATLNLALFALVAGKLGASSAAGSWAATFSRLLGTALLLNIPVYWLVIAAAQAWRANAEGRERERRALRLEGQLNEARLLALRAQIEPHFLFNALNTVAVLMREDVEVADRVLVQLSALLRRSLDTSAAREVELRDELDLVTAYLAIEQARFADRLTFRIDAAADTLVLRVPSLILQPLVENAIRHGLADRVAAGHIEITAERRGGHLRLTVSDDGAGMSADAPEGIGLSNTRARLQLLYGAAQSFELCAAPGGGLRVLLTLPARAVAAP